MDDTLYTECPCYLCGQLRFCYETNTLVHALIVSLRRLPQHYCGRNYGNGKNVQMEHGHEIHMGHFEEQVPRNVYTSHKLI